MDQMIAINYLCSFSSSADRLLHRPLSPSSVFFPIFILPPLHPSFPPLITHSKQQLREGEGQAHTQAQSQGGPAGSADARKTRSDGPPARIAGGRESLRKTEEEEEEEDEGEQTGLFPFLLREVVGGHERPLSPETPPVAGGGGRHFLRQPAAACLVAAWRRSGGGPLSIAAPPM